MRVLVCGGRDFDNMDGLVHVLDQLHAQQPITLVIHGNARGADALADRWAGSRRVRVDRYDADWKAHGRSAGPIRNRRMLVEGKPDLVVAFPGGRGTANMVEQARKAGVKVMEAV